MPTSRGDEIEVARRVRAELARGDIPHTTIHNNTTEARGHFVTTVIGMESCAFGGERGRVSIFFRLFDKLAEDDEERLERVLRERA